MANSPVSEPLDDVSSSLSSKKNWKIYDGLIMVQNLIHDFQQTNRINKINNEWGQEKSNERKKTITLSLPWATHTVSPYNINVIVTI